MKRKVLPLVSIVILLASCSYFSLCGYDGRVFDISEIIDLEKGDIIKYTNGNDTLSFNVISPESDSPNYLTDQQGDYIISARFNEDDSCIGYIRTSFIGPVYQTTEHLMINLDKKESHETDHYQKNIVKYFQDYNFNGKYYRDVFEVIQDTINEPEIIKVPYMLRAIPGGILKFYDSDTKQMWELIN